jgi:hypothetical protein
LDLDSRRYGRQERASDGPTDHGDVNVLSPNGSSGAGLSLEHDDRLIKNRKQETIHKTTI